MPTMTADELKKHIGDTILPILRTELDKSVADKVEESCRKALEPIKSEQAKWMERVLGGLEKKEEVKRENGVGRYMRCIAASSLAVKQGNFVTPEQVAEKWGDHDVARLITEHRQKALAAGDPTSGGFLVPQQFSQDVIEYLRPQSVVRQLGAVTIPMPVGTLKIPKITAGATAYYGSENANITPSEPTTGQINLSFKKLTTLVPISNDLLRYSSPGADALVRDDAVRGMAQTENTNFLRGNGTAGGPRGLRYWVAAANLIAANSTVNLANVTIDLGKLLQKLMDNNIPMTRCGWAFAPRTWRYLVTVQNANGAFTFRDEMNTGRLWGFPYRVNTGVPCNLTDSGGVADSEVYFADFADVVIGESMGMAVDTSSEAAYYNGSSVVAAFSLDQTVVRVISEHDLAVRRDESVAILNQVTWGV